MTTYKLRPYLPRDVPALAAIFQDAVEDLAADDYDADQRAAWATAVADEEAFAAHLVKQLTLVVEADGVPAGFAALEDNEMIGLLYVHPRHARKGVATTLCDALEKLAAARGAKTITTDASDTAQPFFIGRGYQAMRRNTVIRDGQWLGNTTMQKTLTAPQSRGGAS
jgi:putative acetyltransferase